MPRKASGEQAIEGFAPDDFGSSSSWSSAERMASLGRLAAGVAHEINNPLAYVLGNLEILDRQLSEIRASVTDLPHGIEIISDAELALATAKDGVQRIRAIVKDLGTFARAAPEIRRPVEVEAAIEAALELSWNELRHRARVVKRFSAVPAVLADAGQLAQLFVNLILNASLSIPDGRQGVITLSTTGEGGRVCIQIEDDGVEIAGQDLPYVFEPFFNRHGRSGAAGLGLAICRNIVTSLGGTITVESEPDVGTRFTVTLQAADNLEFSAGGNRARGRERVNSRARILIIDDEPLLGQTLRFAFQDRHDVDLAVSGREALARLAVSTDYDLVLCDLMMPDVSGEQVYRTVSEQNPSLLPRFVFMTGGAFTERAQAFLAQFAGRQLEKPFNIGDVEVLLAEVSAVGAA
jgi:CheY-like chemotaxis protein